MCLFHHQNHLSVLHCVSSMIVFGQDTIVLSVVKEANAVVCIHLALT